VTVGPSFQLRTSSTQTFHSFTFALTLILTLIHFMELSIIDLTRETVVCSRCKKKQDDDNPLNREHWKQVRTQSRRTVTVCGKCYTYYVEKSKISRGSSGFRRWFCTESNTLAETSTAERSSSHTTGHVQSVRKLVADSQRGIGTRSVERNWQQSLNPIGSNRSCSCSCNQPIAAQRWRFFEFQRLYEESSRVRKRLPTTPTESKWFRGL